MTLYNNKYRIESTRLKGWDYTNSGMYYITICTANMKKFFGNIKNGEVDLNNEGRIVEAEWENTAIKRSNVILDEFVVMPNHFHGIIAIEKEIGQSSLETTHRVVSTKGSKTLKPGSLGSIVGQFKSKCTKRIWEFNGQFKWQGRFHDRIIRNEKELDNIRAYIHYNPLKWNDDEFYID
jgi:putative transposase